MISSFRENFIFTKLRENKTLAKISGFTVLGGPRGLGELGEKGYIFSGNCAALVIISGI